MNPKTKADIWVLPLEGRQKPLPFLITEFNERQARFSPDGRWVAYTSDESGQDEIYVRSFSDEALTGRRWRRAAGGTSRLAPGLSRTGAATAGNSITVPFSMES